MKNKELKRRNHIYIPGTGGRLTANSILCLEMNLLMKNKKKNTERVPRAMEVAKGTA